MYNRFKEGTTFKGKKEKFFIFVLITGFLLCCGIFGKTADSLYNGGYFGGTWNSPFVMANFNNPYPYNISYNTGFFNTGFGTNYGTFGRYGVDPGSFGQGFNPGYGNFSGYGGFSGGYNPGFGPNYSLVGRYNLFPGSYFSGFGQSYTGFGQHFGGFYPGGLGMPFFPSQGPFDRPVSSDDPVSPQQDPLDPKPGDENLVRGLVYLRETQIYVLESYPMQVRLELKGDLPTPCHQLRATVSKPDSQNRIHVELYSLVEPDILCAQVLEPFEVTVSLGSFTGGSYTVWVNGEKVEELNL